MKESKLKQLDQLGHSIWLDYIRRDMIVDGGLKKLIDEDGLSGMTSNPAIFKKAIADSNIYEEDIRKMNRDGKNAQQIYEALSQHDVQSAADVFRSVFDKTSGKDGYVSLEVNPHLANDAAGTIAEGRQLWAALDRPNVFIKVPATKAGLQAIHQLTSEGINVNVTLLFSLQRYREVAEAFITGLEKRLAQGKSVKNIVSVASFFVSRIDVVTDAVLDKIVKQGAENAELAKKAYGQVAISSAKVAFQIYKELFNGARFAKLAEQGASKQRLLWASTGTKNPNFSDIKYVEALIGPDTVDTIPVETLDAFRDHGDPKIHLEENTQEAELILQSLPGLGIDLDQVTQQLEDEGVAKFNEPFDTMMATLEKATAKV